MSIGADEKMVWVVSEVEIDPVRGPEANGVLQAICHVECRLDDPPGTIGYEEVGYALYGWPHLTCEVCGGPLVASRA